MYNSYYYFFQDYWCILLMIVPVLLGLWASANVKSTYKKYAQISTRRGITGTDSARIVLNSQGVTNVSIGPIAGELTDNFNPKNNSINLSQGVYGTNSVAAVGIAAHEAGHAVQYAQGYAPMKWRSALVPVANIGSSLGFYAAILGVVLTLEPLVYIGIALFFGFVLFELVTLPVEFNASRRAITALKASGQFTQDEIKGSEKVLRAAALTYVAALASAVANLLRLLLIAKGNRRN